MMSMNISPPRLSAARKLASTPLVKARIRNSCSRNMGWGTFVSMTQKASRRSTPAPIEPSTVGLVQPITWWP